ncbi:hypothetical protein MHY87_17000 [Microvirga sp. ACRRW]|nr:hypothetical protein [Microvirga sp. ACRRW]
MKSLFFTVLTLTSLLSQAHAAESRYQWSTHENAEQTWGLSYAHRDSDVGLLWIWCKATTGEITVAPGLATSGIKDGERGVIVLTASAKEIRIEGEASFSEASEEIEISASLPHPQRLTAAFERRGPLRIKVPGNQTTIPLDSKAQSAFRAFARRCPSLKPST